MVFSGNNAERLRLVCAGVTGLLFGMLKMAPAPACGPDHRCATDAIDGFFLPLITASLGDPGQVATLPLLPATTPIPSPLPPSGGAVIITPPPAPVPVPAPAPATPVSNSSPPPPDTFVPVQRMLISQTLFVGALHDGGDVDMFTEMLPAIDGTPNPSPDPVTLSELDLAPDKTDHDMLVMEQIVTLPIGEIWTLGPLLQPVAMRINCGACGPGGHVSRFHGTASLEIPISQGGHGKLTNIDLRASSGSTAYGEMHFSFRTSDSNVFRDDEAMMTLEIDGLKTSLTTRLAAWRGLQNEINGLFIAVPMDDASDPGGIAGQFSGGECTPVCGVEN
jgi:hypothetical protein